MNPTAAPDGAWYWESWKGGRGKKEIEKKKTCDY